MTRVALILVLVAGLSVGCTATSSRSVGSSAFPETGTQRVYSSDGRLLQKTVWRHGTLVAAWRYEQRWELPLESVTKVHRGEHDYPPPHWVQAVINGNGRILTFDQKGEVIGTEDYLRGRAWKGSH